MSVTFSVYPTPIVSQCALKFWCDEPVSLAAPQEADVEAAAHALLCEECAAYGGPLVDPVLPFELLNMANGNAAELLGLLGFAGDELYAGSIDPDELLGRLLLEDALLPESPALPERVYEEPGRATVIDLGRPEGYLNERVRHLAGIARWAAAHDARVCWS